MKRRLWREYTRLTWHGQPHSWEAFLDLTLMDRFLAADELDEMIDRHNDDALTPHGGGHTNR